MWSSTGRITEARLPGPSAPREQPRRAPTSSCTRGSRSRDNDQPNEAERGEHHERARDHRRVEIARQRSHQEDTREARRPGTVLRSQGFGIQETAWFMIHSVPGSISWSCPTAASAVLLVVYLRSTLPS